MSVQFEVGQVIEGKVTGIKPYGAFVALDNETQGLVHISEITNGYVKDINDHLTINDDVTVKVLSVDSDSNKVSLSIRGTQETPKHSKSPEAHSKTQQEDSNEGFNTLKDKLEDWIKQSDEREGSFKK